MDDSSPQNYHSNLNNTDAREEDDGWWNNTAPTSSVVTIGNKDEVNYSSREYVMYLFAHDEAAFGASGTEKITYCGGGSGYGGFAKEDLGWKPAYTMFKQVTSTNNNSSWFVNDEIIGRSATHPTSNLSYPDAGYSGFLRYQNMSGTIDSADQGVYTATSQTHNGTGFTMYSSNQTITYSIRSVDGYTCKKPDAGTDLLWLGTGDSGTTLSNPSYDATFQVSHWHEFMTGDANNFFSSRLQGTRYKSSGSSSDRGKGRALIGNSTGDESAIGDNDMAAMAYHKGWGYSRSGKGTGWKESKSSTCVHYYGNSSAQTVTHFMNAIPSFIIVKARGLSGSWRVYHSGLNEGSSPENYSLQLDDNAIGGNVWNGTAPTSTTFSVGTDSNVNSNNEPYIAYLWANSSYSTAGYYTGNGGSQTITTNFQPRFLVIRRYNVGANTSGAPDSSWIVFDTNRGWSSGNDTVQWWNKNTGPTTNTNYCDPISTGFTLNSGEGYTNNNGDKYIYFAHA